LPFVALKKNGARKNMRLDALLWSMGYGLQALRNWSMAQGWLGEIMRDASADYFGHRSA